MKNLEEIIECEASIVITDFLKILKFKEDLDKELMKGLKSIQIKLIKNGVQKALWFFILLLIHQAVNMEEDYNGVNIKLPVSESPPAYLYLMNLTKLILKIKKKYTIY